MKSITHYLVSFTLLATASVAQGQALLNGSPNGDYEPLHAWYDVNQSLDIWEGRTDHYDDEHLVDVRDTEEGSGDHRGGSYGTNVETWAQFDDAGGDFWPERVGGFTGEQNGMTVWEVRNAAGWDDRDGWSDDDGVGTDGIGHENGFTIVMALNIHETTSYDGSWNVEPNGPNDDTPILNGNTALFNAGATEDEEPGKALLWLDAVRDGEDQPVWVMDAGSEMVAGPVTLDQWQVHTFVYDGGDSAHYIDGELAAEGDAGEDPMAGLQFWSTDGGWHRGGNLDFAEGLFFDAILDPEDRAGMESYLSSKWAIGASPIDIDSLSAAVRDGSTDLKFDVDGNGTVDGEDRVHWIEVEKNTYMGDSNLDGEFNSADFVAVFSAGEYEDGVANNSQWADGDWNGDSEFDSADFVTAFAAGGYEVGPRAAVAAVPEPSCFVLLLIGALVLCRANRD